MEYSMLGDTGLRVSRLAFGCEPLGGTDWGAYDKDTVVAAVRRAIELGVNTFDVANVYGLGRAEEVLAEALGLQLRDQVVVTKFGVNWEPNPQGGRSRTFFDSSSAHLREALEGSLRRLKLDCIPVYLVHWPDPKTPIEDTVEVLAQCQRKGLIRHFGLSNFAVDLIERARTAGQVSALEFQFNLVDRRAEQELLEYAERNRLGVLTYGTLAQGLLTGKYGPDATFESDDRRQHLPHFLPENRERTRSLLARLSELAGKYGRTPAQVAINWALGDPRVTCAIVGAKSPRQVTDNVGAVGWRMTTEDRQSLQESMEK